jgi:hypothetical protein
MDNSIDPNPEYINHSGGCEGSDMYWETIGRKYGVLTISYSFPNHTQYGERQLILSPDELYEGWQHVINASSGIKRPYERIEFNPYIRNLISRNWFQVKGADVVFAIGTFTNTKRTIVNGGTGWAVQMAIDVGKDVIVFDQIIDSWFIYDYQLKKFIPLYVVPTLTKQFAGIGTRELKDNGRAAIQQVYRNTFNDYK